MEKTALIRFGQNIRKLRTEKGWSQEKLSERTGFHRTYIGMVERGERNLSLLNIVRFANALGVRPSRLVDL